MMESVSAPYDLVQRRGQRVHMYSTPRHTINPDLGCSDTETLDESVDITHSAWFSD